MSAPVETAVQAALMAGLRADAGVRAFFGDPPRLYDDESEAPAFPFARIDRHECRPIGASDSEAHEHVIVIAVSTRHGGLREAKAALGVLRVSVEALVWDMPGRHVVLAYVTYTDALRQADRRAFRGLIRIRIISEEVS